MESWSSFCAVSVEFESSPDFRENHESKIASETPNLGLLGRSLWAIEGDGLKLEPICRGQWTVDMSVNFPLLQKMPTNTYPRLAVPREVRSAIVNAICYGSSDYGRAPLATSVPRMTILLHFIT